ncbi:MAG: prepilin-type N-terminal cleavage/methylation domain-containing protein, partial [Chthoniobacteraceae bacterium]
MAGCLLFMRKFRAPSWRKPDSRCWNSAWHSDCLDGHCPQRIHRCGNTTHKNRNHHTMLRKLTNTKHAGFTLVEIMIVVAIIALLAA